LQPEVDRILGVYCGSETPDQGGDLDVRALLGDDVYEQNLGKFLQDLRVVLPQIYAAQRLSEDLKPLVHDMAGCASVLGAGELQKHFQAIEALKDHEWQECVHEHLAAVDRLVGDLEQGLRGAA
jgi:HPt (histidine-containing phosphotransfer) domain-containing protein